MSTASSQVWKMSLVCLAGSVLAVAGCSGSKITTQASKELPRYQVKTMALVPFTTMATPQVRDQGALFMSAPQSIRRSDISIEVPSHVESSFRQMVIVPTVAAEKVTQLFWSRLRHRTGVVVSSPGDTGAAVASLGEDVRKAAPDMVAAAVAKKLKQDAALIGQVLVYQERVGSRLGANPPASVGFEIKVVAADGQVLWVGNYYERQRPMIEDFMGFIHRWAFVTADELAEYGADEVLKEFPFGAGGEK